MRILLMKVTVFNNHTVECLISYEDIEDFGYDFDEITSDEESLKEFSQNVITALQYNGFKLVSHLIDINIGLTDNDGLLVRLNGIDKTDAVVTEDNPTDMQDKVAVFEPDQMDYDSIRDGIADLLENRDNAEDRQKSLVKLMTKLYIEDEEYRKIFNEAQTKMYDAKTTKEEKVAIYEDLIHKTFEFLRPYLFDKKAVIWLKFDKMPICIEAAKHLMAYDDVLENTILYKHKDKYYLRVEFLDIMAGGKDERESMEKKRSLFIYTAWEYMSHNHFDLTDKTNMYIEEHGKQIIADDALYILSQFNN